jgi:hypothetical protein
VPCAKPWKFSNSSKRRVTRRTLFHVTTETTTRARISSLMSHRHAGMHSFARLTGVVRRAECLSVRLPRWPRVTMGVRLGELPSDKSLRGVIGRMNLRNVAPQLIMQSEEPRQMPKRQRQGRAGVTSTGAHEAPLRIVAAARQRLCALDRDRHLDRLSLGTRPQVVHSRLEALLPAVHVH